MAVIEEGLVPSCSRGHAKRLSKLACVGRTLCASEQICQIFQNFGGCHVCKNGSLHTGIPHSAFSILAVLHTAFLRYCTILAVLHTRTSAKFTRVQTPKNKNVQRDAQQRNSLRKPSSGPLILHRLRPLENKIFSGLQSGASCSYIICPKEAARAEQLGARRQDQSDSRQARTGQERQQRKTWR
jgi:hypothetical protein